MGFNNGYRNDTQQRNQLKVDPRLVLNGQLLEMNWIELRNLIETEMVENPALEWLSDDSEAVPLESILKKVAPAELKPSSEDREFQRSVSLDSAEADWIDFAGSGNTLEAHLEAQLHVRLSPEQRRIGVFLIGSLDQRGYLDTPIEEAALELNVSLEEAEEVLSVLQSCEPAGVGAQSLRECLMLQLRNSTELETRLAYAIVKNQFEDLVDRNVRSLARRFRVLPGVIEGAFEIIKQCAPFPADGFDRDQRANGNARGTSVPIDLRIIRTELGWSVELAGTDPRDLMISHAYREQLAKLRRSEKDERRHLSAFMNRAKSFIDALEGRKRTLHRIGEYLIDRQLGFVTTGDYSFLRSLTRRQMAMDLNLHESTISRATMGKHLQLANGEVVSFEVFFKPALRVQQMIAEILRTEDPDSRLSDEAIAALLAERGVHVARRTVNKYRDKTKLLSSRRRKSA
ncbi:MAG: RNA polymerase factor sigma-54 [Chthonomonas sp.]|nr:RNA polymerase factor sigma-54 [Chthonomonas sp.]